jgi:hypothetical protein
MDLPMALQRPAAIRLEARQKIVSISSPLTAAGKVERYAQQHGLSMVESWSASHLAKFLGVSIKTIDRMTNAAPPAIAFLKMEGKRLFHPEDIIRYVDRRTVKAA